MQIFAKGMIGDFVWVLFLFVCVYVMIRRAKTGQRIPEIRKIAGLDAIDEAIGRATEMGRPIHYSPGMGGFGGPTFAGLGVMPYVAKKAALYDTKLIVTVRNMYVHTVSQEIVKTAYLEAGRPEAYAPDDVRFVSDWQFSYTIAVLGIFQREKPAANIMIGHWMAESLVLAEAGAQAGAIQVAGTTNIFQIHFFVVTCDYTLIGEEIYAASAYLSKEPVLTGSVVAQDIAKIVVLATLVVGFVMASLGKSKILIDLIQK